MFVLDGFAGNRTVRPHVELWGVSVNIVTMKIFERLPFDILWEVIGQLD